MSEFQDSQNSCSSQWDSLFFLVCQGDLLWNLMQDLILFVQDCAQWWSAEPEEAGWCPRVPQCPRTCSAHFGNLCSRASGGREIRVFSRHLGPGSCHGSRISLSRMLPEVEEEELPACCTHCYQTHLPGEWGAKPRREQVILEGTAHTHIVYSNLLVS